MGWRIWSIRDSSSGGSTGSSKSSGIGTRGSGSGSIGSNSPQQCLFEYGPAIEAQQAMSLAWRVILGEGERVVLRGRAWADVEDGDDVDVAGFFVVEHTSLPGAPSAGQASLPSRGSGGHDTGACRPCVWHWKSQGCFRGGECRYCHLCPRGELGIRRKERAVALRPAFPPGPTVRYGREGQSVPGGSEDGSVLPPDGAAGVSPAVSVGSDLHGTGDCRPCAWFWKVGGCQNGEACRRCHLCSEGEVLRRWRKKHDDRLAMRRREFRRGP